MLYWLTALSDGGDVFNLFRYITFRAGGAFFTALLFGFLFGPPLINVLRRRQGKGQPIRADGPEGHFAKAGTPTIATFFGYCLGAGLELPLACHFRIAASEGTKIGLPEMDLGSVPAWGGSARLPRVVGRSNALDMILRARKVDGHEALHMGLVTEVVPLEQLKERAQALGEELAAQPRLAVKAVLDTIVGFETKTLDESMKDEKRAVAATVGTPDSQEGMAAFLEKRKPVFNQS